MYDYCPSLTALPGSEIPECFSSHRGKGSSITIKVPSNINHHLLDRLAFCFVFASSSASTLLASLKSKFVGPTPGEHNPIDCVLRCKCRVKDDTFEMPTSELEFLSFDPRLVESDHVLLWRITEKEEFMSWLNSYPGKDVSFELAFYGYGTKPLNHYKMKKWGVQFHTRRLHRRC